MLYLTFNLESTLESMADHKMLNAVCSLRLFGWLFLRDGQAKQKYFVRLMA